MFYFLVLINYIGLSLFVYNCGQTKKEQQREVTRILLSAIRQIPVKLITHSNVFIPEKLKNVKVWAGGGGGGGLLREQMLLILFAKDATDMKLNRTILFTEF